MSLVEIPIAVNYRAHTADVSEGIGGTRSNYITNGYVVTVEGEKWVHKREGTVAAQGSFSGNVIAQYMGSVYYWMVLSDLKVYYGLSPSSTLTLLGTATNLQGPGIEITELSETSIYISSDGVGTSKDDYIATTSGVTAITDVDHPLNSGTGKTSAAVCQMDGYTVIVQGNNHLMNSDLGAPTSWVATNYLTANLGGNTKIRALATHHKHIVVFGNRSISFYYNAGNPSGSPFSPRLDILHSIALVNNTKKNRVVSIGDVIFFLGTYIGDSSQYSTSQIRLFKLQNFQVEEVTTPDIINYLTYESGANLLGFFSVHGKALLCLSTFTTNECLVYDVSEGLWYVWSLSFYTWPGIVANAYTPLSNTTTIHRMYFHWVSAAYTDAGVNYTFGIQCPNTDIISPETRQRRKYNDRLCISQLIVNADRPTSSLSLSVYTSKDDGITWSSARTIDLSTSSNSLHRLGNYREIKVKMSYTGSSALTIKSARMEVTNA